MSVIDLNAAKKWKQIPKDLQRRIIKNVFCHKCHVTTIVDYSLRSEDNGILLQGKCKTCGGNVARLIEDV